MGRRKVIIVIGLNFSFSMYPCRWGSILPSPESSGNQRRITLISACRNRNPGAKMAGYLPKATQEGRVGASMEWGRGENPCPQSFSYTPEYNSTTEVIVVPLQVLTCRIPTGCRCYCYLPSCPQCHFRRWLQRYPALSGSRC